jgi:WhiB family redox-sensing transcriptional regulator
MNVDAFFVFQHERGHERRVHEMAAKAVCARCPVSRRCLDWAVSTQQAYGIWGGATNVERELSS